MFIGIRNMSTPCLIWGRRLLFVAIMVGIVYILISLNPFSKKESCHQTDATKYKDKWSANKSKVSEFNKSHCEIPLKMVNITKICTKPHKMELPHNGTQQKYLKGLNATNQLRHVQNFTSLKVNASEIHLSGSSVCPKNISAFNKEKVSQKVTNTPTKSFSEVKINYPNVTQSQQNLTVKHERLPDKIHAVVLSHSKRLVKPYKPANANNTISLKHFKPHIHNSKSKVSAKHIMSKPHQINHQILTVNERKLNESKLIHLNLNENKHNESIMNHLNSSKLQPQNFIFQNDGIFKEKLLSNTNDNMQANFLKRDHQNITMHKAHESKNVHVIPALKQHQNLTQRIENIFKNISSFNIFNKNRLQAVARPSITNLPTQNETLKNEKINMNMLSSSVQGNNHKPLLNETQQNLSSDKPRVPESADFNIEEKKLQTFKNNIPLINRRSNITHSEPINIAHSLIEDILLCSSKPMPGKTIFFSECGQYFDFPYNIQEMRAHHACAIESAALHNPNFQVFVLFACRTYLKKSAPIIDALLSYKNIKLRELKIETYILNTPITDWLKLDDFYRSSFLMHHMFDLLRLITLYRYGGIYLDKDVLLLRSLEDLHLNYAGAMTNQSISSSILGLEPHGFGHQLAEWFLLDFRKNLVRDAFGSTENKFLLRVLEEVCSTRNVTLMVQDPKRCKGFRVLNVSEFYEVPLMQSEMFFDPKRANEMLERIKHSRLIHIWNRFSAKWPLKIDSKAAYMQLAAKHCPKVFAASGDFFS